MSTAIPRMIIVDDTDPRIQYNGPWFPDVGSQDSVGVFGTPFRSTLHGTQANASIEFAFNGSWIQVFGTNNIRNDSGVIDPIVGCFVDGISIGSSDPSSNIANNYVFCAHNVLDGPHILTVNATVMRNQTFWFDEFRYVPSASTPLEQETIFVDSGDPQLQWETSDYVRTGLTQSKLTFDFIGVSISWYGFTLSGGPESAAYSIDGKRTDFTINGTGGGNQKYFETAQLPAGPHTLQVARSGRGNKWPPPNLEYLVVQNGTLPSITASPSTTTTTKVPVGAIVGGVIGGLILIVVLGLFLLRRYKRRAAEERLLISTPQTSDFELPLLGKVGKKAPAMVPMQRNDTKSPDVGVHEDSGSWMQPDTSPEKVIMGVPPLYTAIGNESFVSREKDI